MDYKIEISDTIDEKIWNSKLLENKASTTYQTGNWLSAYDRELGFKPIFILIRNSSDQIVGQLAAKILNDLRWTNPLIKKIGNKLDLGISLTWNFGPIIHDSKNYDKILEQILKGIEKVAKLNHVTMITGSIPPLSTNNSEKSFKSFGYQSRKWGTYITNLNTDVEKLYSLLDKKTRYDIRKTEKLNLDFEVAKERSAVEKYFMLKLKSRDELNSVILEHPMKDEHWENLYKKGFEKVFLVKNNEEVVGGIFTLVFGGNVIQHGVVNSEMKELQGGSFLIWNMIKWLNKEKFSTFDVGGINPNPTTKKEEQIKFFKSKWNGIQYNYPIYTKFLSKKNHYLLYVLKKLTKKHTPTDSITQRK